MLKSKTGTVQFGGDQLRASRMNRMSSGPGGCQNSRSCWEGSGSRGRSGLAWGLVCQMWEGWQVVLLRGGERGGDGPPGVPTWVSVAAVCGVPPGRWVPGGATGCRRGDCDGRSTLAVLPVEAGGMWLCGRVDPSSASSWFGGWRQVAFSAMMADEVLLPRLNSPVGGAKALNANAWINGREHLGWSQCCMRPSFSGRSPAGRWG